MKNSNISVGLDIGTSKVVCLVGSYDSSENLEILSLGTYPSSGLKKGVVVNIDATTDAINKAVEQAQSLVDEKIKNIFVGISKKFLFLCFLRGISFVLMQIFYYISIINMNFATATTLTFSSPIFIVVLSMLVLKEKIGLFRWSAIFIGFGGVLLIMNPTSELFSYISILPLLAALCWAISNLSLIHI